MYKEIIIDNMQVFYHTRIKLTKSSSIKCDETKIQNLIASSSDLSLCEVRDDRRLYFYVKSYTNPPIVVVAHTHICVLQCAYGVVCGAVDKSC